VWFVKWKIITKEVPTSQMVSMPSLQPTNTTARFALLERQFEAAEITNDKIKFVTLAKCLDSRYLQDVET
jgi:hypothetical protein